MIKRTRARNKGTFKRGDRVRFVEANIIEPATYNRKFYPEDGTVGRVVSDDGNCRVKWPDGSTSEDDTWLCPRHWLERLPRRWKHE